MTRSPLYTAYPLGHKRWTRWARLLVVLPLGLLWMNGCVRRSLIALDDYKPITQSVSEAEVAVMLRVDDARQLPPGTSTSDVGVIDEVDHTTQLYLSDPGAVRYLVRAATKDALRLSRIQVVRQAPRMLVARIEKFWVAVPSREARLVVTLTLHDDKGATLWNGATGGGAGGWIWSMSNLRNVYQRSLADYAQNASKLFTSAAFQRNIY